MILDFNDVLLLVKEKKFNEALKNLDQLIKIDNQNFKYYHLKGTIHFNFDEFSDAIKSFSSALTINKNDPNIYYLRGASYVKQTNYEEAKKDFNKAISLKENFSEAFFGLGVMYFENNESLLAIENFLKSIEFKSDFKQPIFQLIKTLTYVDSTEEFNSIFISKNHEINKINIKYSLNEYIDDNEIKNFLSNIDKIIDNNFENLAFRETQIYRRNQKNLNCKRHKKVFNTYGVIPKFCFGCYKVQLDPDNLIDLIKLYIVFDKIELKNNNLRKCMIELRPNIKGRYKGLIYCNSIEEALVIQKQIAHVLEKNLNKNITCKIKKGCTEFGIKHDKYDSLENDALKYNEDWNDFEKLIDKKFPHFNSITKSKQTINGVTLNDALIIKNWLTYAQNNNDDSML